MTAHAPELRVLNQPGVNMETNGRNNHHPLNQINGDPEDTGDSQYDDAVEDSLTGGE